jgi:hypothetical protein
MIQQGRTKKLSVIRETITEIGEPYEARVDRNMLTKRDQEHFHLKYKRGNSIVSHTKNKTIQEDTHPYIKMKKDKE